MATEQQQTRELVEVFYGAAQQAEAGGYPVPVIAAALLDTAASVALVGDTPAGVAGWLRQVAAAIEAGKTTSVDH